MIDTFYEWRIPGRSPSTYDRFPRDCVEVKNWWLGLCDVDQAWYVMTESPVLQDVQVAQNYLDQVRSLIAP